jgi:hypothetical protein
MADTYQTLDIERFGHEWIALHERVARSFGRIELTRARESNPRSADGNGALDSCVLISKAELDAMERALEILCELPGGKQMCDELTKVAERAMHPFRSDSTVRPLPNILAAILADAANVPKTL